MSGDDDMEDDDAPDNDPSSDEAEYLEDPEGRIIRIEPAWLDPDEPSQSIEIAAQQLAPAENNVPTMPESPFAKFLGELQIGDASVECYVLDTDDRVLSARGTVKAITGKASANLVALLNSKALAPFIDKEKIVAGFIRFTIPGNPVKARGVKAEAVIEICKAFMKALSAGKLRSGNKLQVAINCSALLVACAKDGLVALIDEATGYQRVRDPDALQVKLKAFIADELRDWDKTFPDELWEQFGRLTNWSGPLHSRPKWWGKLVMELIYYALDADIAQYLKTNKPPPSHKRNYHQWLTQDIGLKALITHIYEIIGIAKTCHTMDDLRNKIGHHYGGKPLQMDLFKEPPPARKP